MASAGAGAAILGVAATTAVGNVFALLGGDAVASPSGIAASADVGAVSLAAGAVVSLAGVAADAAVGMLRVKISAAGGGPVYSLMVSNFGGEEWNDNAVVLGGVRQGVK